MKETSLMAPLFKGRSSFRCSWFPNFAGPIAERIDINEDATLLTIKASSGDEEHPSNEHAVYERQLNASVAKGLITTLEQLKYFEMPNGADPNPPGSRFGEIVDGALLVLETNVQGKYHMVFAKYPVNMEPGDSLGRACISLLQLSNDTAALAERILR